MDWRTQSALLAIGQCRHPEAGHAALASAVYRTQLTDHGTASGPGIVSVQVLADAMPRFDADASCLGCWAAVAVHLARAGVAVVNRLGRRTDALQVLGRTDATMPAHMTTPGSDPT